jgi:hypothetical protein
VLVKDPGKPIGLVRQDPANFFQVIHLATNILATSERQAGIHQYR